MWILLILVFVISLVSSALSTSNATENNAAVDSYASAFSGVKGDIVRLDDIVNKMVSGQTVTLSDWFKLVTGGAGGAGSLLSGVGNALSSGGGALLLGLLIFLLVSSGGKKKKKIVKRTYVPPVREQGPNVRTYDPEDYSRPSGYPQTDRSYIDEEIEEQPSGINLGGIVGAATGGIGGLLGGIGGAGGGISGMLGGGGGFAGPASGIASTAGSALGSLIGKAFR